MKYVGFVFYKDAMFALRDDGKIYKIVIDYLTELPKIELVYRLPLDFD